MNCIRICRKCESEILDVCMTNYFTDGPEIFTPKMKTYEKIQELLERINYENQILS